MSELVDDLAALAWLLAGAAMLVHVVGFWLGMWSHSALTWWLALVLLLATGTLGLLSRWST